MKEDQSYLLDSPDSSREYRIDNHAVDKHSRSKVTTRTRLLLSTIAVVTVFVLLRSTWKSNASQKSRWHRLENECSNLDFQCRAQVAQELWDRQTEKQSKTLIEARSEYVRRYRRNPPSGYDDWYAFAVANKVTMIDEYDRIDTDLRPLREMKLTKTQWYDRMAEAWTSHRNVAQPHGAMGYLTITNGTLSMQQMYDSALPKMLEPVVNRLPDLTILQNWYDEPVIVQRTGRPSLERIHWQDLTWRQTWDALRAPCTAQKANDRQTFALDKDRDICAMPQSYKHMHGFFSSVSNLRLTDQLFPILAHSKLSTNGDIVVPSPVSFSGIYRESTFEDKTPFLRKSKGVYWRGSTTGMMMLNRHWIEGHRQRFVLSVNNLQKGVRAAKEFAEGRINDSWPSWLRFSPRGRKMLRQLADLPYPMSDVAFSRIDHCDGVSCDDIQQYLKPTGNDPTEKGFGYQVVADLDGEAWSGRFYRLLDSNSVPLKQTIWHEWHDGRIMPWVHYVPLSLSLDELQPLLTWLLSTESGQRFGARIAQAGKTWTHQNVRTIDATVYYYRLLLEYAEVLNGSS